ncbi:MAG: ParB N-terminal domain-containing protein [Alphaproteobacteria bacterium]|nr:ParB N-terminal domain-containing protein [Alphaproteobacteria bacterium]
MVDEAWVEAIAASIEQKGQDTPIQVRRNGGGKLHLVAGAHRLEACKRIGVEVRAEIIVCTELEARLIEIDENLFRRELGALDRAVFLAERKKVYLEMFPETKKGAHGGRGGKKNENDTMSFSKQTAKRINLSARSVERAISIAENIPADVRKRLIGTKIAEKQADLLYLASLDPSTQRKAVTLVCEGSAKTLKAAAAKVLGTEEPDHPENKPWERLMTAWTKAPDAVKAAFVATLRETGELDDLLSRTGEV